MHRSGFWTLYFAPSVYKYPVLILDLVYNRINLLCFSFKVCLRYSWLFVFTNVLELIHKFPQNFHWDFNRHCIECIGVVGLGSIIITLNFPITDDYISLHLFRSSLFIFFPSSVLLFSMESYFLKLFIPWCQILLLLYNLKNFYNCNRVIIW